MENDRQTIEGILLKRGIEFDPNQEGFIIEAGYTGFYTSFRFDDDGKLISIEAYE